MRNLRKHFFETNTKSDLLLKEGLQRLLRIGSAHNIGGLHDLEIAQISHVLIFFEHKLYLLFIRGYIELKWK